MYDTPLESVRWPAGRCGALLQADQACQEDSMFGNFVEVVGGLALLLWGADRLVHGAASGARTLGVPPLMIGLTIVAFATSAPEILVSVVAALRGEPGLAFGNAIGSNIVNGLTIVFHSRKR